MNCQYCGKEINEGLNFCVYCGKRIAPIANPVTGAKQRNTSDKRLEGSDSARHTANENKNNASLGHKNIKGEKQNRSFSIPVIAVVIAVAVVLCLLVVHFLFPKDAEKNEKLEDEYIAQSDSGDEAVSESSYDQMGVDESNSYENDSNTDDDSNNGLTDDDISDMQEIDVESEVSNIRDKYDCIMDKVLGDQLNVCVINENIRLYEENGFVVAIFIDKGFGEYDYSRKYYYDQNKLIFAYFEGNDAHRLYFKDDVLIRWRYAPDANDFQSAENYDGDYADGYRELESYALNEAYRYLYAEDSVATSGYIIPDSDKRYLTEDDLTGLTKEECRLARNEIYARHGRKFDDEQLRNYFSKFEWYHPSIEPDDFLESMLNEYEISNRDLIVQFEKEQGYYNGAVN